MKSSVLRLAAVPVAIVFAFAACGKKASEPVEKSVTIWHWMTDREDAFQELARRYKAEKGVDVKFQLYAPSDAYSQKVRVGAQTGSLPEIYGVLGDSRDLASFIEAGHVENLKERLEAGTTTWKSLFYEEALNTSYYREGNQYSVAEGYYGIPIDVTTIPLIYNKKLFKKAGLNPEKPPVTWDEFIEAGKKLKKAGVTGFTSGWAETWLIYSLATNLAHNLMGYDKVMETFRGKVPYTDTQWIEVFQAFEKMQKAGFLDPSLVTLGNKSAEQAFASERAGITFNGSWAVNVYGGMNPTIDYAPMRTPGLNPKFPRPVWGGAGSVFSVNAKSANKDLAVDFLKWLSERDQATYLANATKNLPAVKDVGEITVPVLKGFAELMRDSIHPNRFAVTEDPKVQEVFCKGIQSILIGEKTPLDVAQDVQKAKEKLAAQ